LEALLAVETLFRLHALSAGALCGVFASISCTQSAAWRAAGAGCGTREPRQRQPKGRRAVSRMQLALA
jgi:hypothetical protein